MSTAAANPLCINLSRNDRCAARMASSPKNSSSDNGGRPTRIGPPAYFGPGLRDHGSSSSRPAITAITRSTSSMQPAIVVMQSRDLHAGTSPTVLMSPREGLYPRTPLSAAGTRPEPAVSVATANGTSPRATASADPELDPPEIICPPYTLRGTVYGARVPLSPVANWSRLVLPT